MVNMDTSQGIYEYKGHWQGDNVHEAIIIEANRNGLQRLQIKDGDTESSY